MASGAAEAPDTAVGWRWPLWAGFVALALIAWRVLSLGQADALASRAPDSALAWRSSHTDALLASAQSRLANGDRAGAEALSRQALAANPLDGRGYRMLAEAALASGRTADALRRYELASQRSPRDLPSHQWLAAHYVQVGDYPRLLAHLDSVLRVQPELAQAIFPDMVRLATIPRAQPALARLLLSEPPWRAGFLVQLSRKVPDVRSVAALMEGLRHAHDSLAEDELSAWLDRLVHDRQWGAAYLTWVAQLPREKRLTIGNVFDGGFDWLPSNNGFGWRFDRIAGARIDRAETSGASNGSALRVAFADQRVRFSHVRQLLALQPGPYRLEGRVRLDSLRSERGLVWSVVCAESRHEVASSESFSGNSPWRPFAMTFTVPGEKCGGQWLLLRLPARIRAEERIGGAIWFDDLQIARATPR